MTTYYSNNNLFSYTVNNNSSTYTITNDDYTIIAAAFNRWDDIVEKNSRFSSYTISVTVNIDTLDAGILGGAGINTIYYFDSQTYGNVFPASGTITMSDGYLPSLKTTTHTDGNTSYYHVFLHELGHILGIGSLWSITDFPKISYTENSETKYYYTGAKALQEYRNYFQDFSYNSFVGIPFEDNGSSGTINVHPEEGSEGSISADNRYINGVFHPGLDTELMTGWLDTSPTNAPLSKITIAYLEDMGYGVDYTKADTYRNIAANSNSSNNSSNNNIYMSNNHQNTIGWLDNSNNANCFLPTVVQGFLDISGGNIITRNIAVDTIKIKGDVSLNQSTKFAATVEDTSVVVSKDNSSNFIDLADNATLTTFGFDLSGSYPQSQSGHSMSKNYNGSIIALGASENSAGAGINRGIVRVYQKSDLSWVQLGGDLSGVLDNQHFGHSLDLNGDGTILAVGTKDISHNTLVYKYDSGSWGLYGNTIKNNVSYEVPVVTSTSTIYPLNVGSGSFNSNIALSEVNYNFMKSSTDTRNNYTSNATVSSNGASGTVNLVSPYTNGQHNSWNETVNILEIYGVAGSDLTQPSTWQTIYRQENQNNGTKSGFGRGFILYLNTANGSNEIWLKYRDEQNSMNSDYWISWNTITLNSSNEIKAGEEYHIVVYLDSQRDQIKVYVNGDTTATYSVSESKMGRNSQYRPGDNGMNSGEYCYVTPISNGTTKYVRWYKSKLISDAAYTAMWNSRSYATSTTDFDGGVYYETVTAPLSLLSAFTKPKLNKTGDKLTILSEQHIDDLSGNGQVQTYQYSESDVSWNYFGNKIESAAYNDISGGDIAINDEGNMIAIGYPNYETESSYTYTIAANGFSAYSIDGVDNATITLYRGVVTNFNISASGHPFYIQTTSGAYNASSVYSQITGNGSQNANISFTLPDDAPNTLYYVCQYHSGMAGTINVIDGKGGYTKVYKYDSSWNQVGSNINAESNNEKSGTTLVMDGSGDFVTVGAPAANSSAGKVRVYQNINDSWIKKGNDMEGASSNDEFGSAISMNASGDIMVVGAPNVESAKGKAYVHEYNVTDNSWNLKTSVTGTSANDKLGSSVRLNGLGTEVSVGEPGLTVSTPSYDWNFRQNSSSPIYDSISNYPATFSGITANTTNGVRTTGYIAMSPSTQGPSFSLEFYYYCHTNRDTWAGPTTYNFHLGFYSDTTNYDHFNWTQRGRYDAKNIFAINNYANGAYNYSDHQQYDSSMHPNIGVYHDVITMDGANLIVYRNGNPVYTDTTWIGDFPTADMIYSTINKVHPSVNTSISGTGHASSYAANLDLSVYSYRLWNNHALSASEVSTLYANRETSNYFSNVAKFRTFQMEHTQNFYNFKYLQVPIGRLSIGVENGTNMLDVSGSVFISKDLTVSDDLSLNNGTVFVHGDLSVNNVTINAAAMESISTSQINYNSDVSFSKRLFVNANDISHNGIAGSTSVSTLTSNQAFALSVEIPGENSNERSFYNVKISGDGNFVIMGSKNIGSNGGARYYSYDQGSNSYTKIGTDIGGPVSGSQFGGGSYNNNETTISYNGKTFAVGAPAYTTGNYWDGNTHYGTVWIYMYDPNTNNWTTGNNNVGFYNGRQSGAFLCLNKSTDSTIDGTYLLVSNITSIYVYKYSLTGGTLGGTWSQYGPDIYTDGHTTGQCPSAINSDGTRVALGLPTLEGGAASGTYYWGGFEVYEYSVSDNSWNILGSRINYSAADIEYFGHNSSSIASGQFHANYGADIVINSIGDIVAIRSDYPGGALDSDTSKIIYALVYKYDGSAWTLLGNPIIGSVNCRCEDIAISGSGYQIAIGGNSNAFYHAVYQYTTSTNTWDLITTNFLDDLGTNITSSSYAYNIDITTDGKTVIAGGGYAGSVTSNTGGGFISNALSTTETVNPIYQTHASDLASNGSFSSDIAFNHSLIVPGNMVIVDGSNKTTYGSYTTYTDPSGEKFFHAGKSASNVFNIVNQSNVGVYMASGQSTFSSTSDKKLKTNIQPLENSLEKIEKLNPVSYQWKENKKEDIGFIAQEVEEIMPELVEENETFNGENQKGIKTSELIPFILESLNEINKELNEL